jgi:hypothetical protein
MASPVGESGRSTSQGVDALAGEKDRVTGGLGELLDARGDVDGVADQGELELAGAADLQQAQAAVDRLADVPTEPGMVVFELWPLRSRALLARAHGDEAAYRDYRDRYRAMARTLEFEGHMKWAEAMP